MEDMPQPQSNVKPQVPLGYVQVSKRVLRDMQRAIAQVMVSTDTEPALAVEATSKAAPTSPPPQPVYFAVLAFVLNLPAAIFWVASFFYILGEESALERILSYLPVGGAVVVNFIFPLLSLALSVQSFRRGNIGSKSLAVVAAFMGALFCVGYVFWLLI